MTIAELAEIIGVTESAVAGYVDSLAAWMAKGYTLEEAIAKNMAAVTRIAERAVPLAYELAHDEVFVGALYDDLRASAEKR